MLKFIVINKDNRQDINLVQLMPIDYKAFGMFNTDMGTPMTTSSLAEQDVNVGDIVSEIGQKGYKKIEYHDCKRVLVTGADTTSSNFHFTKVITFFSPDFGEKKIKLDEDNSFFYTQRGDELMVRENATSQEKKYEIITNLTVDKMRSQFLIQQR